MGRSRKKKNKWQDHYTVRAKKENYPARSVYKLEEIQRRFKLIKKGDRVLDLGCAPGSWLRLAAKLTGEGGKVVGIDLNPLKIALPPHAEVYTGDILAESPEIIKALENGFDVVISDMAPATTGNKDTDAARSLRLSQAALSIAEKCLRPGGHFVGKIFQGPDFQDYVETVKTVFKTQKTYKPQSSRKASKEIFVIGMGKL